MKSEIRNQAGERLEYQFHPGREGDRHVVVLGHGVTGNMDRPLMVALAEGLAKSGISALRFSFAGNGGSEGRFVDATISKEIGDLGAVIDALTAEGYEVGYAGHSMGAAVGVLTASQDERVRFLISLGGMVHTDGFAQRELGEVEPDNGCMWDDPDCPLSKKFMDDMAKIGSVEERAAQIRQPWLLVHGTEDDVVPIQDSYDIFERANEPKELIEVPGADHVFSGDATSNVVAQVTSWARKQLS